MTSKSGTSRKGERRDDNTKGITVTVGTSPTLVSNQVTLDNELRLTRSSLLYADHVKLIAPAVSWIRTMKPLESLNPNNLILSIANLPSDTLLRLGVPEREMSLFRRRMRLYAALPKTHPQRIVVEKQWSEAYQVVLEEFERVYLRPDTPELDLAIERKAVTLISEGMELDDDRNAQISGFRERVLESLKDPSGTVLLDQMTEEFVRQVILPRGYIGRSTQDRSRRASVGTGLVERLPTFPDAPMETILEVREELSDARKDYRNAVKNLNSKLASQAFDPGLPSEIDELWHDEVQPTLVAMKKQVSLSRLGFRTGMRLITDGYTVPTLLVGVVTLASFADLLPTLAGGIAGASRIAVAGAAEAYKAYSEQQDNSFVYLLNLNKQFGNHSL